jgi:hypothetical protein
MILFLCLGSDWAVDIKTGAPPEEKAFFPFWVEELLMN